MADILQIIIALIWLIGTWTRVYRQARYYQIEEYMSDRYLRWLFADRMRWLPTRPVMTWVIGAAVGLMLAEAPGAVLPGIIAAAATITAVWPPDEGEIKKPFRRTQRATRLLGAAPMQTLR